MANEKERILLVESNPEISSLIARQALGSLGYPVQVVDNAAAAIQQAVNFAPDVVIANLDLPGLSGKDLLVALASQSSEAPVIVVAPKGSESHVIQAFRLGASDYILWPAREAEVVSAVERVLNQVRARRERESLARRLKSTNDELQTRLRELTTIVALGKAVVSLTDQRALFDKLVESAVSITSADAGWLMVREDARRPFLLAAQRNLPPNLTGPINQPWDDGISSLVALSGESLLINGDPLKRFRIARLAAAAMIVPVKIKNEVIGLLAVIRKANQPFQTDSRTLLEAVADYASISLVNASLFRVLEERARQLQSGVQQAELNEAIQETLLRHTVETLLPPLQRTSQALAAESLDRSDQLRIRLDIVQSLQALQWLQPETPAAGETNLNELTRQALARFQPLVRPFGLALMAELSSAPLLTSANPLQTRQMIEALLGYALHTSPDNSQIAVRLAAEREKYARLTLQIQTVNLAAAEVERLFTATLPPALPGRGVPGIDLGLARRVAEANGGRLLAESDPAKGTRLHLVLPLRPAGSR